MDQPICAWYPTQFVMLKQSVAKLTWYQWNLGCGFTGASELDWAQHIAHTSVHHIETQSRPTNHVDVIKWSFDVFFDLRLNKRLCKQSRRRWFEMPSCSLWRYCNVSQKFNWLYRGEIHGFHIPLTISIESINPICLASSRPSSDTSAACFQVP